MLSRIRKFARAALDVLVRLWIGDPRAGYEKVVFDALRGAARVRGGAA